MNTLPKNPPTTPPPKQSTQPRKPIRKLSERGLLSIVALMLSLGFLTYAMLGGARLVYDVFDEGLTNVFEGLWMKVIVIGLSYSFGWIAAIVCIRVYGNLILPMIIKIYAWGCLAAVCALYVLVLQRLYLQHYDIPHYLAYVMIIAAGLGALVGLHLVIEGHDLRPFSIPLLIIALVQFGLIIYRYVFVPDAKPAYLWGDLFLFFAMSIVSFLMLAHMGILTPFRKSISFFFDQNSIVIRPQE